MSKVEAYHDHGQGSKTLEAMECAENINAWIAGLFEPYLGERNLELGAGIGTISQYLVTNAPIDFCENSNHCADRLKSRFNQQDHNYFHDFFAMKAVAQYNCIYSSNVLEHFEDDEKVLQKAYDLLAPGGYFVAYVPAIKVLYSEFDKSIGHFRRYADEDLQRLSRVFQDRQLAYYLVEKQYYHPIGALLWLIKMRLLGSKKVDIASAKTYDRVFPYLLWMNPLVKLVKGQNLLFAFQKGVTTS